MLNLDDLMIVGHATDEFSFFQFYFLLFLFYYHLRLPLSLKNNYIEDFKDKWNSKMVVNRIKVVTTENYVAQWKEKQK